MDDYRGTDSSTGSEYSNIEWASLEEPAHVPHRSRLRSSSMATSALPGVAITEAVSENERHRRTIAGILVRLASEGSITRSTLAAAECFIEALPRGKHLPKVAVDGDGGLLMAWSVPGHEGRTLITIAHWMVYAVVHSGTPDAHYFPDMPFDGVIADELLAVLPG